MPTRMVSESPRRVPPHKPCPQCKGGIMTLSVQQPDEDGRDMQTFECLGCGHSETRTVRR